MGERWGAQPQFTVSLDDDSGEEDKAANAAFAKALAPETQSKIETARRELLDWSTMGGQALQR